MFKGKQMFNKLFSDKSSFMAFGFLFVNCSLVCLLFSTGSSFCMGGYDIFDAIDKDNLKDVKTFIAKNKVNLVNRKHATNSFAISETLLNAACYKGNLKIVEVVCDYLYRYFYKKYWEAFYGSPDFDSRFDNTYNREKINNSVKRFINQVGRFGNTPLICACSTDVKKADSFGIVKYLISAGAIDSIDAINYEGRTAVDIAFTERKFDIVKFLIDNYAKLDREYMKSLFVGAEDRNLLESKFNFFCKPLKQIKKSLSENLEQKELEKELEKAYSNF